MRDLRSRDSENVLGYSNLFHGLYERVVLRYPLLSGAALRNRLHKTDGENMSRINWNSRVFYCDGGCLSNDKKEGRVAYGSISDGENVIRYSWPQCNSNNEAEFQTLYSLLVSLDLNAPGNRPTIYMDSKLVVNSLTKGWKIKSPNLKPFWELCIKFLKTELRWVPRDVIEGKLGH